MKISEEEKRVIKLFKLLSNSTRFEIIKILERGSQNVTTLANLTNKEGSTISKHLRLLSDLDVVSFTTVKNQVIYSLKKKKISELIDIALLCIKRT